MVGRSDSVSFPDFANNVQLPLVKADDFPDPADNVQLPSDRNFAHAADANARRNPLCVHEEPQQLDPCAAVGFEDGTFALVSAPAGSLIRTFKGPADWIASVDVDWQTGRVVATCGDGCLWLWKGLGLGTGIKLVSKGLRMGCMRALAVEWTNNRALTGSDTGRIALWEFTTCACKQVFPVRLGIVECLEVDWSRLRVMVGHGDGNVDIVDIEAGQLLTSLPGHTCVVKALCVNWAKKRAFCGSGDGALVYWDLSHGTPDRTFKGHKGGINAIAVNWDLRWVVSAADDCQLRCWSAKSGDCLSVFKGFTGPAKTLAVDWVGKAVLGGSSTGELVLWDFSAPGHPYILTDFDVDVGATAERSWHGSSTAVALLCPFTLSKLAGQAES